jgi:hypothetical protein
MSIGAAVSKTACKIGLRKRVTCHSLRHSFATHLIESGSDIRTVRELLGHKDVSTTMVYTHVLQRGARGVRSPLVWRGRTPPLRLCAALRLRRRRRELARLLRAHDEPLYGLECQASVRILFGLFLAFLTLSFLGANDRIVGRQNGC